MHVGNTSVRNLKVLNRAEYRTLAAYRILGGVLVFLSVRCFVHMCGPENR